MAGTGAWAKGEERERGSVSCANEGSVTLTRSANSARPVDEAASPAECITNAFCVIRLKR